MSESFIGRVAVRVVLRRFSLQNHNKKNEAHENTYLTLYRGCRGMVRLINFH